MNFNRLAASEPEIPAQVEVIREENAEYNYWNPSWNTSTCSTAQPAPKTEAPKLKKNQRKHVQTIQTKYTNWRRMPFAANFAICSNDTNFEN